MKCDKAFDLWQQLELSPEIESDLRETVDWRRKWLVNFNAGTSLLVLFDCSDNTGAILRKNNLLRCWSWLSFLKGMRTLTLSVTKTASKKIGALIRFMKFLYPEAALYLYKSTIQPYMKYFFHVCDGGPNFYLEMLDKP